ncbi:hypothetical protein OV450_7655, partial [Actinobacteria bacterium OV450]
MWRVVSPVNCRVHSGEPTTRGLLPAAPSRYTGPVMITLIRAAPAAAAPPPPPPPPPPPVIRTEVVRVGRTLSTGQASLFQYDESGAEIERI